MSVNRILLLVLLGSPVLAQQNPTLSQFLSDFSTAMNAINGSIAGLSKPRIILTGQLTPASQLWISSQANCTPNVTCSFNNAATFNAFLDALNRLNIKVVDVNIWLEPFACDPHYIGALALDCATGHFWKATLANYDTMFIHAAANGQTIRAGADSPTAQMKNDCGLTSSSTESDYEACTKPLITALVQRYGSTAAPVIGGGIASYQIVEEPLTACGVLGLATCFGVSGWHTYIVNVNSAIKAVVPTIKTAAAALGVGGTYYTANDTAYWNDWRNTLSGTLDILYLDVFQSSCDVTQYPNDLSGYATMSNNAFNQGWEVRIGQSWMPGWCPLGGAPREAAWYEGLGDTDFISVWIGWIPTALAWAGAEHISSLDVFCPDPFFYETSDHTNDHCTTGTYSVTAMSNLPGTSTVGSWVQHNFPTVSLQGNLKITGKVAVR